MVANQNAPGLKKGLTLNFWCLGSADHMKFREECVMCMEKYVLVKKTNK